MELLVVNVALEMALEVGGEGGDVLVLQEVHEGLQVDGVGVMRLKRKVEFL